MILKAVLALSMFAGISSGATSEPPSNPTATDKAITPAPDTSPLVHEAIINAPVTEVWRAFSTNEGFKLLGVAQAKIDFRVGGLMQTHYDPKGVLGDEGTIENTILAYEPERMLSFRISKPPKGFPFAESWKHTWSVATFTDLGDGRTNLRLAGLGYTAADEDQKMRAFFQAGNAWVMKKLQSHYDASVKPTNAAAHDPDPLAPVVHEVIVPAPRSDVWSAISTAEGWRGFLGAASSIELRPGGPFEIYFNPDAPKGERGSEGCTVLSLVPQEMLSFTWNAPPKLAYARTKHTWVVITLDAVNDHATRVRIRHLGFAEQAAEGHADEWREVRAYFANAWGMVARELAAHFERPQTRTGT